MLYLGEMVSFHLSMFFLNWWWRSLQFLQFYQNASGSQESPSLKNLRVAGLINISWLQEPSTTNSLPPRKTLLCFRGCSSLRFLHPQGTQSLFLSNEFANSKGTEGGLHPRKLSDAISDGQDPLIVLQHKCRYFACTSSLVSEESHWCKLLVTGRRGADWKVTNGQYEVRVRVRIAQSWENFGKRLDWKNLLGQL